jgi:two-component system sensor histidine kinase PilS (NtrC family)
MSIPPLEAESELYYKLKWLMFFRWLFTTLLLGSTVILQLGDGFAEWYQPLVILYELIVALFVLTFIYSLILRRIRWVSPVAYIQIAIDITVVTVIIFLTGSFSSFFSFLYLVVIIYASMLLYRNGSMVMAAFSSIQYGVLVDLEYYGVVKPFVIEQGLLASSYPWSHVLYKVIIVMLACFAVAFLSGFLSEQAKKTQKELRAMEAHVKRVEKMAIIGEMAAGMAHEIKNPLASLRGSIQLLKEEIQCGPDHERLMNIILREADRLSALVSNFLLFARPPAGKSRPIDLSKSLGEFITIFEKKFRGSASIQIIKDISPGVWMEADPDHLKQVLWNLLLNAAESIQNEGRIEVILHPQKDMRAIIKIRDNGCGIPQDIIQTIFDPFMTTKPSGTGLGLSIVHRILESYDCRIDVESDVGRGTVFSLRLKRIPPPESD